jgi:uncharacterized protein
MRRSEREITDRRAIDAIIRRCRVCRLGLSVDDQPYVVPLNFGYDGRTLYFHAAPAGRKLDMIRRNPRVCFEFDRPGRLTKTDDACSWSMTFESVIGFGIARLVDDPAGKAEALAWIMRQYDAREWTFPEATVGKTLVIAVDIEQISGKAK